MKLSLGCGHKPQGAGWLNHDQKLRAGVQLGFDLSEFPWPVANLHGKITHILAEDVLEHIPAHLTLKAMDECWALLTPTGTMEIQVPIFGGRNHLADLTHCRGFSLESFDLLDPDTPVGKHNPWYTTRRWKILSRSQDEPGRGFNLHFLLQKRP